MDTRGVLDHHLEAFNAGDAAMILEDYTDDSVLITANGVVRGREALLDSFKGSFSGLFAPGTYTFTMDSVEVEGDVAYIAWHASCAGANIRLATDTFVVRDGKITAQTFTAVVEPT